MLVRLQIQNFTLIRNINLEFDPRLNVLTGETGAGKSILIDAICFALGERFDNSVMLKAKPEESSAKASCSVEVVFEIPQSFLKQEIFSQFALEEEGLFILRREVTAEGRNRVWINNRTATNAALKEIGGYLIDLHGQHDHQLLLDARSHLHLIDQLAKNAPLKESYHKGYEEYAALLKAREDLQNLQQSRERELDLLKYQIEEIEGPDFSADEEAELKHERIRLANAEKLYESVGRILQILNDEDTNVSGLLGQAAKDFNNFVKLDPSMEALKGDYESAQLGIEEIIRALRDYQEKISFDGDRLTEVDGRMDQIDLVKRKYGGSLSAALQFLKEAKIKYDKLQNSELYGKEIDQKIAKLQPQLKKLAEELSEKRKRMAASLKRTIETELKDLNIPQAVFESRFEKKDFAAEGIDQMEFLVSLNPGQEAAALRKVISGGEASRVMLALKKALMKVDPVPTLIFDEIDANIGGRLGHVVGEKLKEIAGERQVILITHLPQIASFADLHIKVTKKVSKGQTTVDYEILQGEARVRELSHMMSGQKESDISRQHAQEMLARVSSK